MSHITETPVTIGTERVTLCPTNNRSLLQHLSCCHSLHLGSRHSLHPGPSIPYTLDHSILGYSILHALDHAILYTLGHAIIYTLDQSHCRVLSLTGTLQNTSRSARLTSHFRVICHGHGEGQLSGRVLHAVLAAACLLLQSPHPFRAAETSAGGAWTLRPRPLAVLVRDASQDASQHGPHPVHLSNTESDKSVRRTT